MKSRSPDLILLLVVFLLVSMGIVMVYSASSVTASSSHDFGNDPAYFLKKQVLWALLGVGAMFIAYRARLSSIRKWAPALLTVAVALLALVLIPAVGQESGGARRWLLLGGIALQPAELAKLALLIFFAASLSPCQSASERGTAGPRKPVSDFWKGLVPNLLVMALVLILVDLEPDLGTATVIAGSSLVVLFLAGAKPAHLFALIGITLPFVAMRIMHEGYRLKRLLAFANPWSDPTGAGYHIIQSLLALGSGRLLGLGLGHSRQKFFYLPECSTDYIFSIIGEELGFAGASAFLILFGVLIYRGFKIAMRAPDRFSMLLASGITVMLGLQAVINIGVVANLLPPTGITLPFVSYGGSSLFFSLLGIGLLLNVSRLCDSKAHLKKPEPKMYVKRSTV